MLAGSVVVEVVVDCRRRLMIRLIRRVAGAAVVVDAATGTVAVE